jgi:hypothetical protein
MMGLQLDVMNATTFKVTADGRRVFFPLGRLGRSYEVASEEDYKTLQRKVNQYTVFGLIAAIVAVFWSGLLAMLVVVVAWTAFYAGWMWYLLPTLKPSDEKLKP